MSFIKKENHYKKDYYPNGFVTKLLYGAGAVSGVAGIIGFLDSNFNNNQLYLDIPIVHDAFTTSFLYNNSWFGKFLTQWSISTNEDITAGIMLTFSGNFFRKAMNRSIFWRPRRHPFH